MATFTYAPNNGAIKMFEPRTLSAQFGDGYEQVIRDGINNNPEVWEVSFAYKNPAVADLIETFLLDHGAVNVFNWTAPNQAVPVERTYRCKSWTRVYNEKKLHTINATFKQKFG